MATELESYHLAQEAKNLAHRSMDKVEMHEAICSERYANINTQLGDVKAMTRTVAIDHKTSIEKVYLVLDQLRTAVVTNSTASDTKSKTSEALIRTICLLVGAFCAIVGLTFSR